MYFLSMATHGFINYVRVSRELVMRLAFNRGNNGILRNQKEKKL